MNYYWISSYLAPCGMRAAMRRDAIMVWWAIDGDGDGDGDGDASQ